MTDPVEANEMAELEQSRGIPDEDRPHDMPSAEHSGQVFPERDPGRAPATVGDAVRELKDKVVGND